MIVARAESGALRTALIGLVWIAGGLAASHSGPVVLGGWLPECLTVLPWLFTVYGALRLFAGLVVVFEQRKPRRRFRIALDGPVGTGSLAHYQTLGLRPGASTAQVVAAYRELAKVWHPDQFAAAPELRGQAERRMKALNAAYRHIRAQLSDPA